MKVLSVVGARPQFIKAHPLHLALKERAYHVILHTGQHYDREMSRIFFEEMGIPEPDYNLEVGSGGHGEQTGRMLIGIEKVLLKERPDAVIVYGDTNSTLAGALASVKLHIPVAHVEAGLRSFDRRMPEVINRVVADHISNILFAPTHTAVHNLKKEGIVQGVYLVGDIMVDALYLHIKVAEKNSIIRDLGLKKKGYVLVTVHRAGNTDVEENLKNIVEALTELDYKIVFPAHPRTKKALERYGLLKTLEESKNVMITEPVGYLEFLNLLENSKMVLTDSGGVQKEAYILGIPCVTLRDTTEWIETVEQGWNVLVGAEKEKIISAVRSFRPTEKRTEIFGDGKSAERMANIILSLKEAGG